MTAQRFLRFEDSAMQAEFCAELERSGISPQLDAAGGVIVADEHADEILLAAHRVRDSQFPWYFLVPQTSIQDQSLRRNLREAGLKFFVQHTELGVALVVPRSDRDEVDRIADLS